MTDTPLATTRVLFSDLHGNSHGKYLDSAKLDHPTHYAITVLTQGLNLDMVEAPGFGADVGYPDMEGRVDMRTRRLGWEPGIDIALVDLWRTDNHEPVALDPRWALSRQVDRWRARGLEPLAGFEMEFFVLAEPSDGKSRLTPLPVPSHRVYAAGPGCDPSGLAVEIYQRCRRAGIAVDGYNGEFHPGQVEGRHWLPRRDGCRRRRLLIPRASPRGGVGAWHGRDLYGSSVCRFRRQRHAPEYLDCGHRWQQSVPLA